MNDSEFSETITAIEGLWRCKLDERTSAAWRSPLAAMRFDDLIVALHELVESNERVPSLATIKSRYHMVVDKLARQERTRRADAEDALLAEGRDQRREFARRWRPLHGRLTDPYVSINDPVAKTFRDALPASTDGSWGHRMPSHWPSDAMQLLVRLEAVARQHPSPLKRRTPRRPPTVEGFYRIGDA